MKSENFVGGETVDPNWLEELVENLKGMIQDHDDEMECHENLMQSIRMDIEMHGRDGSTEREPGTHVLPAERDKWDDAAEKVEALVIAEGDIQEAREARNAAETARNAAEEAEEDAKGALAEAQSARNAAKEYRDLAFNSERTALKAVADVEVSAVRAETAKVAAENAVVSARYEANRAASALKDVRESANLLERYVEDNVNDVMDAVKGKAEQDSLDRLRQEVEEKANAGKMVANMAALEALPLPGDVSEGVIYTAKDRVATNGYLVTGKVSELFETGPMSEFGGSADELYVFAPKFTVPDSCVEHSAYGDNRIHVYTADGDLKLSAMNYPYVSGYPAWLNLSEFGASSADDTISFYVAKLSQPDESAPEKIEFEDIDRAFYHNGESWVEVMTTEHLGDIDKALDAILDLDSKLLGGDA